MDDTINRATFSPLAIALRGVGAIAAKVRATVDAEGTEGYEDESGFHVGSPTFKS
jgi:hypothetical protein